jgi:hypothetical protein
MLRPRFPPRPSVLFASVLVFVGCAAGRDEEPVALQPDASVEPVSDAAAEVREEGGLSIDAALETTVEPATDVEVVITADNAYSFGWGDVSKVAKFFARKPSTSAGEIFNCPVSTSPIVGPEDYDIPASEAPGSAYLYVVSWSDRAVTQGVIGQFQRKGGSPLFTGTEKWQVCATGNGAYQAPADGPPAEVVNEAIAACNAGTGDTSTTSGGWVDAAGAVTAGAVGTLAIGEDNSEPGGTFPIACSDKQCATVPATCKRGISERARWMWYQAPGDSDPFRSSGTNKSREFLIFRLPATALPPVK